MLHVRVGHHRTSSILLTILTLGSKRPAERGASSVRRVLARREGEAPRQEQTSGDELDKTLCCDSRVSDSQTSPGTK